MKMPANPVRRKVDFLGAALLGGLGSCALLVAEWGGAAYAWASSTIVPIAVSARVPAMAFA
ncbi:hypothetical protein OG909_15905 [Streptomyces sp. NBC_01754]|uniref:hypothetical protein n=1 Tax=Streptomyces sp. NBC_01754 TaxID=2975930 RepID=UPI002DDC7B02|nr:hypothetical protein [Streptomyces sp. NBC_01754]WSC93646.1 hypothetical protein OG909_15905 [Streptomyces sp. NBC_01754]